MYLVIIPEGQGQSSRDDNDYAEVASINEGMIYNSIVIIAIYNSYKIRTDLPSSRTVIYDMPILSDHRLAMCMMSRYKNY